ncbi:cyclodeaminase/cyclohydrolase family protein [Lacrimispora sp.]|jgi:formiminotetrahydrofolate cyclodeaminase|uniref:cyclodeaminase/cyclohydrolase family protein n=1 Tax=Lacrimispora sp. TaxID=2719234 RepID=UPI0028AD56FA|nr:cyclodeaminase/cyclohydrolase family protein [Lacrimispora sp.]
MIQDFTVSSFLEELSSKKPTPGGGGAAGLAGAVGTALGEMVVNLTLGKKKYADVEEEMQSILMTLTQMREEFLRLADEDAVVFAPLAAAYSLPATTEEEKKKKEAILEDLLVSAALVPLSVMELCLKTLDLLEFLGEKGSRLAVSDVGVGVQMIRASILGAKMNVYINTKTMVQREKARELNARAQSVSEEGIRLADTIYTQVEAALKTE